MVSWLIASRDRFQSEIFDFLWRQWRTLGVAGTVPSSDTRVIDPEALLLFSLSVCRYEPRLFDEVLDWLVQNGHFINVQRLRQMHRKHDFAAGPQLSAVAELLAKNAKYKLKWSGLIGQHVTHPTQPLFLDDNSRPLPTPSEPDCCPVFMAHGLRRGPIRLREYSQPFDPLSPACLLLRMRALIGMNARAEILCLLASVQEIHPSEAARQTSYYQKTVQTILLEMVQSGVVSVRTSLKTKHYRFSPKLLDALVKPNGKSVPWIHWPSALHAVEMIWRRLHSLSRMQLEPLLLASELRKLLSSAFVGCLDPSLQRIAISGHTPAEDLPQLFRGQLLSLARYLNPEGDLREQDWR